MLDQPSTVAFICQMKQELTGDGVATLMVSVSLQSPHAIPHPPSSINQLPWAVYCFKSLVPLYWGFFVPLVNIHFRLTTGNCLRHYSSFFRHRMFCPIFSTPFIRRNLKGAACVKHTGVFVYGSSRRNWVRHPPHTPLQESSLIGLNQTRLIDQFFFNMQESAVPIVMGPESGGQMEPTNNIKRSSSSWTWNTFFVA